MYIGSLLSVDIAFFITYDGLYERHKSKIESLSLELINTAIKRQCQA